MLDASPVANEVQITIRVGADIPERADALLAKMAALPEFRAFRMSRMSVMRLALLRGMEALEQEHAGVEPAPKASKRKR